MAKSYEGRFEFIEPTPPGSLHRENESFELFWVRGWDLPILLYEGVLDFGITGLDVAAEISPDGPVVALLNVRPSEIVLASNPSKQSCTDIVVSEYPNITRRYAPDIERSNRIVPIRGAAEGLACAHIRGIVTLSASQSTLKQNGLYVERELLHSDACLLARQDTTKRAEQWLSSILT